VGDSFQIIADVEATEAEAPGLAASVVGWLTAEGIIAAEPTDCVLGAESGYAPGPQTGHEGIWGDRGATRSTYAGAHARQRLTFVALCTIGVSC